MSLSKLRGSIEKPADQPRAADAGPMAPATNVRYQVLAWMCGLSMITYIDRVCIKQVGPDIRAALDITDWQWAWVFAAFGLAYALFEVPSGWLGDRLGPRKVLCRIVLCWSVFTALTGCVFAFALDTHLSISLPAIEVLGIETPAIYVALVLNGFLLLLLIRFLFGMGEAGAYPNIARALRNWFPFARRGLAQGLLWMFGRWGGAVAPLLISVLAGFFGWRGAFIAFGFLGLLWVVLFRRWYRDSPAEHPAVNEAELHLLSEAGRPGDKPHPLSWTTMLRSPTLWCLSGMYFFSNCGWCFFITWDVEYYKTVLHLDGTALHLASGAPLFCGGIACLLGGFLTDRQVRMWGRRWGRTLQGSAACLIGGMFFVLALAMPWAILSVVCLCLASFTKDFAMAASWSTCLDIGHRYSGTVSGFMNMVGNLGTFFSPPIVAHLARKGDWDMALIYSAAMFLTAAVCWLFINPRRVIVYRASVTT
jgi:ACS family glucarate transporter-like MFS transporter